MRNLINLIRLILFLCISCQLQAMVDPTRPPNFASLSTSSQLESAKPALQVEAIFKKSTGYQAMINHKLYSIGEKINQLTISKITHDAVFFSEGSSEFQLTVTLPENSDIKISKSKK
jgi:hypothetical protein